MKHLKSLLTILLLLIGVGTNAALPTTGYYRIKSHNSKYLTENLSDHTMSCTDLLSSSYAQVWYLDVSGSDVTIKNALTDRYVEGSSTLYQHWVTTVASHTFTLGESDDKYSFANAVDWGLHCDNNNEIVGYYISSDTKSKWTVESVTVNDSELTAQQAFIGDATTDQLTTFFTSTACTALKSPYAEMEDAALRSAMSALPTSVQNLAVKVKNNSWDTYAGWDKTEKTFRIADYKAYSSGDRWTSILNLDHHIGRLSNPTGIYATAGDILQVYVGEIPSGETVKLEVAGTGQASGVNYALEEGLNLLLMTTSGNCFVYYEVDNTASGGAPYTDLSTYADVTVHIEGGTVQGYFDLTKGDTNLDWAIMKAYLLTEPTVCLKSKTHVFNLHKDRLIAGLGGDDKIVEMMTVWQDVAELEDNLIARGDYDNYCNNVFSVTTLDGTGAPHATTYGTFYYEGTNDLFNAEQLMQNVSGLWTIAHEQGHNHQKLIKMIGTTEMSNNMFSNAVLDWQGRYTSRVYNIQNTYEFYQQGMSWLERLNNKAGDYHLWECMHLYLQLYQYFHQAGINTDFYPDLYRALRSSPMTFINNTPVPASEDYLKFYMTCCDVAGLDLTEFFTAYGFFMLPPAQEPQTINAVNTGAYYQEITDYLTYYVYVNQTMIDDAKAYVASKGYPRCNLIFIEDRVTAPLATYTGHADGERRQLSNQDNVSIFGEVGETGQYTTFGVTPSAYTYNVTARGTVKMVGTGAVGFIVYDNTDNHIIGYYNTYTFNLPYGASNYTIKAAAGDGTVAAAALDASIAVEDFPKSDTWYTFASKTDTGRFVESKGAGSGIVGTQTMVPTSTMHWKFVLRTGETETFDIVNRDDNSYVSPTASNDTQISTTTTQPATGWKIRAVGDYYTICSGSCQFNQTSSGHSYQLYNWGSGVTTDDNNCLFKIQEAADGVYIADGTTANGPSTYGDAKSGALDKSKLQSTWVSKAASGHAGISLSASHKAFMEETSYGSFHCLGFKPSAGNATDIINITAPVGYKIVGYYLEAGYWTSSENYTLTASEGTGTTTYTTSAAPSNGTVGLNVTGINKRRTAIIVKSNQSDNSKCLMMNRFWVFLTTDEEVNGAAPNLVGRLVTSESQIVSDKPYFVRYVGNGKKAFVKDINNNTYYQVTDNDAVATTSSIYYFHSNGDGTWKLKNYVTEKYWGAPSGTNATDYLTPVAEGSASNWTLNYSDGIAYPKSGSYYLTRSSSKLHGWASNSNSGFEIYEAEAVPALGGLSELTGDGWYRLQLTTPDKGYVENNTNEFNFDSNRYPLTYQLAASIPYVGDAINYVRVIRDGDNVHIQSANGHYLTNVARASLTEQNITVNYASGFQFSNYLTSDGSGSTRIIGKSSSATSTRFALYPVDYSEEGLNAWNFILVGSDDDYQQITCNRTDVSGLSTIYSGGYFFLPKGVVPAVSDFNINGVTNYVVNTTTKTITATIDPSLSLQVKDVTVIQGNQTTGKGNTAQALLRVKVTPFYDCSINKFSVTLTGAEQLDNVAVYTTTNDELQAESASPTKISSDIAAAAGVDIPVTQAMTADQSLYFWITGDVKSTATEWETIDAAVTAVSYTNAYTAAHSMDAISCDLSSIGDPDGEMRIYKQQQFLWTSSTTANKYYRIPTIMKTKDGGIVALADYRHDHPYDLGKTATNGSGGHVIDVVSRRNADCGNTWESEVKVAVGDGTNEASYGYGDPAIVRDNDGTLHCLMAAGNKSYASGMLHMGYSKSTNNGASWSAVTDIYNSIDKGALSITSAFTTGGKGVTFDNGRMAFAFLGNVSGTTNIYPIYSDDKGASWKLGTAAAYTGGDETKFEIKNDNSLLASVKIVGYNATGNRGKNSTTGDASGDGISTWNTKGAWDGNMVGNGCNADIIYYSRTTEGKRDVLLHTLTKSYSTHRKDLRLYMSFDQGATWQEAFQLQPGWAAYSSMQVLDNGDLAIIFEDGSIGNEDKNDCYAINYVTISKETLQARIAELNGPDVTYHIMFNGSEVASNATPEILQNTATAAIPNDLKRAFCTYQYYSDAGLTSAITQVGTNQDIYVKCTSSAPFEYSTELAPKWFFIHSREQSDPNDYFANADGTTFRMTAQADVATLYANDAYKWAFIGSPYSVRLINKGTGKPLAATANSGSNASNLTIGVTDNSVSYPYDEFVVYGYGGILNESSGVTNAFTLILKDTEYAFLIYDGKMKYYSSGVSINASLGLTGWRSSDMMTIEASDVITISAACTDGEGNYYGTYSKGTAFVVPSDLTVSEIQVVDGKLKLTNYATDDIVPANTGVLVSSTTPGNHTIILAADGTSVLGSGNLLKPSGDAGINAEGMAAASASGTKFYRLTMHNGTELGFWWGAAEGGAFNLAANKAYLAVPSGTLVKGFSLSADDLTDGISQIEDGKLNIENAIYDLSGRRISVSSVSSERSVLPKGVYIVNGKKYIKK